MAPPVPSSTTPSPTITRDPRFRAGRKLVGTTDGVEMFALLLAEAREKYSADHTETIPGYYEYGNALLRYAQRGVDEEEEPEERRDAAAAAAERRAQQSSEEDVKPAAIGPAAATATNAEEKNYKDPNKRRESATVDNRTAEDTEDVALALEMMETAWSILDEHLSSASNENNTYTEWMMEQRPRILTGLGDTLIELQRPADATDAYLQALQHRQDAVPATSPHDTSAVTAPPHTLQVLQARRRVVEANILVTEALLACRAQKADAAVVTSETKTVLVPAGQVVSYATGYYDKARDELEEVVVLLGQLSATKESGVDEEKEDVCFVATLVMGAGETLAQIDEEEDETTGDKKGDISGGAEPAKKKPKR